MPVAALSDVTESLERLMQFNIEHRLQSGITVNTSSASPLDVQVASHLVNLFLFHLHPEGKPSTVEAPTLGAPHPRHLTKPVSLYYHVTTHHNAATEPHLIEQELLGHALATLMDYGEINDTTVIGPHTILVGNLQDDDNRFETEVLVKGEADALNVWAAHEGGVIRPSLYFKLKNVRLAPEPPIAVSGPILSIGSLILPKMGPRLFAARASVTATLPTAAGPISRQFQTNPAAIHIGAGSVDRSVTVAGSSLDALVAVELTLPEGSSTRTITVDFDANAANGWAIAGTKGGIVIDMGENLDHIAGGLPATHNLEPGEAQIRVLKTEMLEREGALVPVDLPSNALTLSFNPHIQSIIETSPRRYRITLDGAFDLEAIAPPADHTAFMRLAVGQVVYGVEDLIANVVEGTCAIAGPREIDFILTLTADVTNPTMVQLWIRDAGSQPFWIGGP